MYSSEIDGETTEFGTSGMLYRSNKLMYDRRTQTLWHQFRGEPVVGPLAGSGIRLEVLPVVLTTWGDWVATHPGTTVLDIFTGVYPTSSYRPESDVSSTYYSYRNAKDTMFPVALRDQRLAVKEQVFGLVLNGAAKAYPRYLLEQSPVLNDTVGTDSVVIVTAGPGAGPRAYLRGGNVFRAAAPRADGEPPVVLDESGAEWTVSEDALVNSQNHGQRLLRLPGKDAFWFGWFVFYPDTDLYFP